MPEEFSVRYYKTAGKLILDESQFTVTCDGKTALTSPYTNIIGMRRMKLITRNNALKIFATAIAGASLFGTTVILIPEYWYIGILLFIGSIFAVIVESKILASEGIMLIGKRKTLNFIPTGNIDVVEEELRKRIFLSKEIVDSESAEKSRLATLERVKERGKKIKSILKRRTSE
ncbi:MAG: hypothetical protein QXL15_01075 [Candidatus Korarchaeota archaeon]